MLEPFGPTRWRIAAITLLALAAFAGCAGLDTQQRRWIFQASVIEGEPGARHDDFADVWIDHRPTGDTSAVRLHGLWLDGPSATSPVMLYLHGSRRNVEASVWRIQRMRELGFAVLAIDYRGFGRSTDALPSEASVAEDARAAWHWLAGQHPGRDRYVFGHSLGGAIAVQLAAGVGDAKGLIVEGTFTSIPALVASMRWGWLPLGPLITQRFDSAQHIARVKAPLLVVHGARDSLIPAALGRALFDLATTPRKRFVLVEGGTHYSTNGVGHDQYRDALRELFGLGA